MRGMRAAMACAAIACGALLSAPTGAGAASPAAIADDVTGDSLGGAISATRKALAAGGVATRGKPKAHASRPAAWWTAAAPEVVNLAADAQQRAITRRMSLADLANTLRRLRFPFRHSAPPARRLADYVSARVGEARRHKRRTMSFTPLFLAAMAARQHPAVKIAKRFNAAKLYLSNLEVQLLMSDIARTGRPKHRRAAHHRAHAAATPCTDLTTSLDEFFNANGGTKWVAGTAIGKALEKLVEHVHAHQGKEAAKGASESFGKAMTALEIAARAQKLATIYRSVGLRAYSEPERMHKPEALQNQADTALAAFYAVAEVDPEALKAYEEAAKDNPIATALADCIEKSGLPHATTESEVAEASSKWVMGWDLSANPQDARINFAQSKFDAPGTRRSRVTPLAGGGVGGRMYVDIQPEPAEHHPDDVVVEAPVVGTVFLDTSEPPDESFVASAVFGIATDNVAGTVIDATTNFFSAAFKPRTSAELTVEWHVPCRGARGSAYPRAVLRQAKLQCGSPTPATFHGSAGGTATADGVTQTWSGTFTLERVDGGSSKLTGYHSPTGADTGGTIQWQVSGTDSHGCSYSASATVPSAAIAYLYSDDHNYEITVWAATADGQPVSINCPNEDPKTEYWIPLNGVRNESDLQPYGGAGSFAGSRSYPQGELAISWNWSASG